MSRFGVRRRVVTGICAAVVAPVAILTANTASAEAELRAQLQATYPEVCPGYRQINVLGLRIPPSGGTALGYVFIGRRDDVGRVCVATIKTDSVRRDTQAIVSTERGVTHRDNGLYRYYAGEPCTFPQPRDCSAVHARDSGSSGAATSPVARISPSTPGDQRNRGWAGDAGSATPTRVPAEV